MNDLQSTFLIYYQHLFPPLAAVFSSGITLKIVAFYLEASCLCCCVHSRKRNWQCFSRLLSRHFHLALITCCNVSRAGYMA